ncbi:MAG: hypothetical protein AAF666_19900 [Pseudomonadota bacterium]
MTGLLPKVALLILAVLLFPAHALAAGTQTEPSPRPDQDSLVRAFAVTHCESRAFTPLATCIKGLNWAVHLELGRRYGPEWSEPEFRHAQLFADFRFDACANNRTFQLFIREFRGTNRLINAWVSYLVDCLAQLNP